MRHELKLAGHAHTVVMVHGLWMHGIAFALMARRLRRRGFDPRAFSYRSVRRGLDENAHALSNFLIGLDHDRPPHVLAHSLGGLVVLRVMALRPELKLGRVVLMGSPAQGASAAITLCRCAPMAALIGRSMRDWLALAPPDWPLTAEVGVISGDRSLGVARLLDAVGRPNDGVVAVSETELPQASARITLHCSHSEMLISRRAADAAAHFFSYGGFTARPAMPRDA